MKLPKIAKLRDPTNSYMLEELSVQSQLRIMYISK